MKKILLAIILLLLSTVSTFAATLEDQYDVKETGSYEWINDIKISPDGKGYIAGVKNNGKYFAIKDGIISEQYDSYVFINNYSNDGKHYSYDTEKDGKYILVKDGVKFDKYDYNGFGIFSPDSTSFTYNTEIGTGDTRRAFLIKDGVKFDKYELQAGGIFSPDSKHFVYFAKKDGKKFLVTDLVEGEKFEDIQFPQYSEDGKHFMYGGKKDGKWLVIIDGITKETVDSISDLKFLDNLNNYILITKNNGKYLTIKNGIKGKEYDEIDSLTLNYSGKSYAYVAKQDDKRFVVKDGIEGAKYEPDSITKEYFPKGRKLILSIIYSQDGKNFIYVANNNGKYIIVRNGIEIFKSNHIENPIYSQDGKTFCYIISNELSKWSLVLNGVISKEYDNIQNLEISNDGSNIIFAGSKSLHGKQEWSIVKYTLKNGNGLENKEKNNADTILPSNESNYNFQTIGSSNQLSEIEKAKGDLIINKINKIIDSKIGKEQETQGKIIKLLSAYKIKAKNIKLKQLIKYVITGIK